MAEIKKDWDVLSKDERQKITNEIITFFADERNEKIGVVAANQILDFFLRTTGGFIYNKALDDTKTFFEKKLVDSIFEIDVFLRKMNP